MTKNQRNPHNVPTRGQQCACAHLGEYHWLIEGDYKCIGCVLDYTSDEALRGLHTADELEAFVSGLATFTGIDRETLTRAIRGRLDAGIKDGSPAKRTKFGGQVSFGKGGKMKGTASLKNWKK